MATAEMGGVSAMGAQEGAPGGMAGVGAAGLQQQQAGIPMELAGGGQMTSGAYQQYVAQMNGAGGGMPGGAAGIPGLSQYAVQGPGGGYTMSGAPPGAPGGAYAGGVDEAAMYAAYTAAMQQQSVYGGGPYAAAVQTPPGAQPGMPQMSAGSPAFYSGQAYPGPAYYDPYGMLNPAACVAPVATQTVGGQPASGRGGRKKKSGGGLCGCC